MVIVNLQQEQFSQIGQTRKIIMPLFEIGCVGRGGSTRKTQMNYDLSCEL
uniref:Uncharacterized protein n=1 Tax=Anguilla anguilla TaxID=7936 RepID=A0A0E9VYD5_ANGAN